MESYNCHHTIKGHESQKADGILDEIKEIYLDLNKRLANALEESPLFSDLKKTQDLIQQVQETDLDLDRKMTQIIEATITWSDGIERIQDTVNGTQDAILGNDLFEDITGCYKKLNPPFCPIYSF